VGVQPCALEGVVLNKDFWHGKRVLLTGHTGFKGGWLALWLQRMGATVAGFALPAESTKSMFHLAAVGGAMESVLADIRDLTTLQRLVAQFHPEIVFHLAAQPLVRLSYLQPVETYQVNVMGTVHLLETLRSSPHCRVVVSITSDKCYENKESERAYRESDPLGGYDPYSSSKACAELVNAAYRSSFFQTPRGKPIGIATARAGNVIGGGDFSRDRLVPDTMAAFLSGNPLSIRNPDAIRPWQHVLEPLSGYLQLAEKLWGDPQQYAQGWNFGPAPEDAKTVLWVVEKLRECWRGRQLSWNIEADRTLHEAKTLTLDSTKAHTCLGWKRRWNLEQALSAVVSWYQELEKGGSLREASLRQIATYEEAA
jgi:CDP-glucose 4,6-dehydratase